MATVHQTIALITSGTAYEILPSRDGNGRDVTIQNNNGSAGIFLGGEGVTSSDYGFKLLPGAAISFELDGQDSIWAVASENSSTVNVLQIRLEGTHIV